MGHAVPALAMSCAAELLSYLILLRLTGRTLPPIVASWQQHAPTELDELHQALRQCPQLVDGPLRREYDFRSLTTAERVLVEAWQHTRVTRTGTLAAAELVLFGRLHRRHLTADGLRASAIRHWYLGHFWILCQNVAQSNWLRRPSIFFHTGTRQAKWTCVIVCASSCTPCESVMQWAWKTIFPRASEHSPMSRVSGVWT